MGFLGKSSSKSSSIKSCRFGTSVEHCASEKKRVALWAKKTCVNTKISFIFYIIKVWHYNNWCKHVQTSGIDAHMQRTVCNNVTARPYGLPRHAQIPAGQRFGISRTTNPKPWKLRILQTRKHCVYAAISLGMFDHILNRIHLALPLQGS